MPQLGIYSDHEVKGAKDLVLLLEGVTVTPFGAVELGIAAGFVGLFFICFLGFAKVFPGTLSAKS